MSNKIWKTKNGKEIPLDQMTDNHLINSWRFFTTRRDEVLTSMESGSIIPGAAKKLAAIEKRLGLLVPEMIKRGMHR